MAAPENQPDLAAQFADLCRMVHTATRACNVLGWSLEDAGLLAPGTVDELMGGVWQDDDGVATAKTQREETTARFQTNLNALVTEGTEELMPTLTSQAPRLPLWHLSRHRTQYSPVTATKILPPFRYELTTEYYPGVRAVAPAKLGIEKRVINTSGKLTTALAFGQSGRLDRINFTWDAPQPAEPRVPAELASDVPAEFGGQFAQLSTEDGNPDAALAHGFVSVALNGGPWDWRLRSAAQTAAHYNRAQRQKSGGTRGPTDGHGHLYRESYAYNGQAFNCVRSNRAAAAYESPRQISCDEFLGWVAFGLHNAQPVLAEA